MSVLAAIRPDEWGLPLFVHVLGALTLVGALVMAAAFLRTARAEGTVDSIGLSYRALLFGALPAYIVMRVGAQWIASEEGVDDSDAAWIGIGYMTSEGGLLALVIATILTGVTLRRARRAEAAGAGSAGLAWAMGLTLFLILAYTVTIWVMAAKPA